MGDMGPGNCCIYMYLSFLSHFENNFFCCVYVDEEKLIVDPPVFEAPVFLDVNAGMVGPDNEDGDLNPDLANNAAPAQGQESLFPNLQSAITDVTRGLDSYLLQPILYLLGSLGLTFIFTLQIWATVIMACVLFSVSKFDISWTATNQFIHIIQAVFMIFGAGDWFTKSWHYLLKRFNLEKLHIPNLPFKVTCSKCNSVYDYHDCYERHVDYGADGKEIVNIHVKNCMYVPFPNHPQAARRRPCNTTLLKDQRRAKKGNVLNLAIYRDKYSTSTVIDIVFFKYYRMVVFARQL